MLQSQTPQYHATVFKQQLKLASQKSDNKSAEEQANIHPLKAITSFFGRSFLFSSNSQLGEDYWPEELHFDFNDLTRLFESLLYEYDDNLLNVFTDQLLQFCESKYMTFEEINANERHVSYSQWLELMSIATDLTYQGVKNKSLTQLMRYCINMLLIQIDELQDFSEIIKSITVDEPMNMKLLSDSISFLLRNRLSQSQVKEKIIKRGDVIRLLQYCEDYDQLVEQVLENIKTHKSLQQDIDIALYAKIGHDIELEFKMEDTSLNSKVKRMIIRSQGVKSFLESDTFLNFMRDLKNSQHSLLETLTPSILKSAKEIPKSQKLQVKEKDQWQIDDIDESIETFSLILYACGTLSYDEIVQDSKVLFTFHLIFDLLHLIMDQIEPWFMEQIILKFNEENLLKQRLGATGETLYDLTEEYIIKNWGMFSDHFRFLFRSSVHES